MGWLEHDLTGPNCHPWYLYTWDRHFLNLPQCPLPYLMSWHVGTCWLNIHSLTCIEHPIYLEPRTHTYTCMYVYVCVHIRARVCVRMYKCMHMRVWGYMVLAATGKFHVGRLDDQHQSCWSLWRKMWYKRSCSFHALQPFIGWLKLQ